MFAYLDGMIGAKWADALILEVSGVGYRLTAAPGMLERFGKPGERQRIYTYLAVREDALTLYGFSTREEQTLFEMLITVSGVGPKLAGSIVADMRPDAFAMAVVTGDDTALTRVKGLGKKGAQRIILELKDKLGHAFDGGARPEGTPAGAGNGMRADAISALMVLGYSSAQATRAVDQVLDPSAGLEDTIKAALAHLLR